MSVPDSMTLRDTFAAAALAGLLVHANDDHDEDAPDTPSDIAYTAYQMADAMLRERDAKNHDAAPAARASLPTADHAVCRGRESGCGTGDTPRVQPAIDRLREWERHGSGRWGLGAAGDVTMLERRLAIVEAIVHDAAPAARAHVDAAGISRQGTGDTPAPHATHGEGSVPREGTEPVAWAVVCPNDEVAVIAFRRQDAEERATASDRIVPLYRQPHPTLTDAEREAVARLCEATNESIADDKRAGGCHWQDDAAAVAVVRGLLERLG